MSFSAENLSGGFQRVAIGFVLLGTFGLMLGGLLEASLSSRVELVQPVRSGELVGPARRMLVGARARRIAGKGAGGSRFYEVETLSDSVDMGPYFASIRLGLLSALGLTLLGVFGLWAERGHRRTVSMMLIAGQDTGGDLTTLKS